MNDKFKHRFAIGPIYIDISKNTVDGGYNVWLTIYPTRNPNPRRIGQGELGWHDLTLTFTYRSDEDPEWCEYERNTDLDGLIAEALKVACSNDEDLYKVEAEYHLYGSDGPTVIFKTYKERISGDKWTLWKQEPLLVGFWVSDETGRKMIEKLKEVTEDA